MGLVLEEGDLQEELVMIFIEDPLETITAKPKISLKKFVFALPSDSVVYFNTPSSSAWGIEIHHAHQCGVLKYTTLIQNYCEIC